MSSHDRITDFDVEMAIKASKEARHFTDDGWDGGNTFRRPTYPPLIAYKEKLLKQKEAEENDSQLRQEI